MTESVWNNNQIEYTLVFHSDNFHSYFVLLNLKCQEAHAPMASFKDHSLWAHCKVKLDKCEVDPQ